MFDKKSDIARFLAVAEAGAITLAADRLAMTQPALTRVIERIERRLGGRLFERMPTGVRLTALGAALAAPARGILREYDAASQAVDAARSGAIGRFRVTAAPVWTEAILAKASPNSATPSPASSSGSRPPRGSRGSAGSRAAKPTCTAAASTGASACPNSSAATASPT